MTTITLESPTDLLVDAPDSDAYGEMIESAKTNCGWILQAIDWAVEKVLHKSLIEIIMSPIAGDFNGVAALKTNWQSTGLALTAIGNNYSTIAGAVNGSWRAPAATKADASMVKHAAAHRKQGTACGLMSRQIGNMLKATEEIVSAACGLLGIVEEVVLAWSVAKLAKLIATGGGEIRRIIRLINEAIDLIKSLPKLIPALAAACGAIVEILSVANVHLNLVAADANRNAGGHIAPTSEAGFQ